MVPPVDVESDCSFTEDCCSGDCIYTSDVMMTPTPTPTDKLTAGMRRSVCGAGVWRSAVSQSGPAAHEQSPSFFGHP